MSCLPREITSVFDALADERERMGFVWLGTQEADTRTPGGVSLAWGRSRDGALHARVIHPREETTDWEQVTAAEWSARWPHADVPPALPAETVETR